MPAGAIGDKIQFFGLRRIDHGFQSGAAGIADRRGRQRGDHIGVVRRLRFNIAAGDGTAQTAFAADQTVNDGGIGLQPHFLVEPVQKHPCDARAFIGLAGFLFDDGGQHHHFGG